MVRDAGGLGELVGWIDGQTRVHGQALPLVTARLVAQAALDRRESRGGHFRSDFPEASARAVHTRLGGDVALGIRAA